MSEALLSEKFRVLVEGPGGLDRLRSLVLVLAIRGRLIPSSGQSGVATATEGVEPPFEIPESWLWRRVDQVGEVKLGRQRSPQNHTGPNMRPYLRVANVLEARIDTSDVLQMNFAPAEAERFLLRDNDILLNEGQSYELVGRPAIYRGEIPGACFQNTLIRFRPGTEVVPEYALIVFRAYMRSGRFRREAQQTTNIAHLSAGRLAAIEFPLPPYAEQKRIVAKVDQLMALCDELEAKQAKKREVGNRLTKAALGALSEAESAGDLRDAWRVVEANIDELVSRPDCMRFLREAILSLGVTGRLVGCFAQDVGSTVGDYVTFLNGYAFKSEWFSTAGVRLLRNANVGHGQVSWRDAVCLPVERVAAFERFALSPGDIVLSLDRPIISTGVKVAVVTQRDLPCLLLQRVGKVVLKRADMDMGFLYFWFNSSCFSRAIDPGRSNGVPHISTRDIERIRFSFPPLDRQRQAAERMRHLMSLCDDLEAKLRARDEKAARLAEALVAEVLA